MIIDAHVHLVTMSMILSAQKKWDRVKPGIMERAIAHGRALIKRETLTFLKSVSIPALAHMWLEQMDKNGVDKALFLPIRGEGLSELDEFISLAPDRFKGYVFLDDPVKKSSQAVLRRWLATGRFRGLKLYPSLQMISAADKRLFPLYDICAEYSAPVLMHFGITHAPVSDYRFTNPLDIQYPSKLFPDTQFMIAHFGAGFFREILLLGFHSENIHLDTSGTNNWRLFLPSVMGLDGIFKRAIEVYGCQRILFGTDSVLNGVAGYRQFVLDEQAKVLKAIKLKKNDQALIMGGNAQRLFNLDK
ncbi:MAG: amidohydrolase [Nitrospinae bacterium]|nr:amidohydrolase [Nitrospinota bacterium]